MDVMNSQERIACRIVSPREISINSFQDEVSSNTTYVGLIPVQEVLISGKLIKIPVYVIDHTTLQL